MYSVYLVDDEPLVLTYMKKLPWREHEFEVTGTFTDPKEALARMQSATPDVLFTDIHMAPMDGLELIRQSKDEGLNAIFVVVSAYDKFEYARTVIQLEGFDYLIKPVAYAQYADLMARLKAKLDKASGKLERPTTMSVELNQILKYLKKNFAQKHSLGQVAQQFNIHPNYICRLFSKHLGTTFSSYLTTLRMEHALSLLKTTEKSVKEIAALSGYDDYFYFCRVFREVNGCTPTQYRSAP